MKTSTVSKKIAIALLIVALGVIAFAITYHSPASVAATYNMV